MASAPTSLAATPRRYVPTPEAFSAPTSPRGQPKLLTATIIPETGLWASVKKFFSMIASIFSFKSDKRKEVLSNLSKLKGRVQVDTLTDLRKVYREAIKERNKNIAPSQISYDLKKRLEDECKKEAFQQLKILSAHEVLDFEALEASVATSIALKLGSFGQQPNPLNESVTIASDAARRVSQFLGIYLSDTQAAKSCFKTKIYEEFVREAKVSGVPKAQQALERKLDIAAEKGVLSSKEKNSLLVQIIKRDEHESMKAPVGQFEREPLLVGSTESAGILEAQKESPEALIKDEARLDEIEKSARSADEIFVDISNGQLSSDEDVDDEDFPLPVNFGGVSQPPATTEAAQIPVAEAASETDERSSVDGGDEASDNESTSSDPSAPEIEAEKVPAPVTSNEVPANGEKSDVPSAEGQEENELGASLFAQMSAQSTKEVGKKPWSIGTLTSKFIPWSAYTQRD